MRMDIQNEKVECRWRKTRVERLVASTVQKPRYYMTAGLPPLVRISPPSEGASRDVRVANAIHRLTSLLV